MHIKIKDLMVMAALGKHGLADLFEFKAIQICTASTKTIRKCLVSETLLKKGLGD